MWPKLGDEDMMADNGNGKLFFRKFVSGFRTILKFMNGLETVYIIGVGPS